MGLEARLTGWYPNVQGADADIQAMSLDISRSRNPSRLQDPFPNVVTRRRVAVRLLTCIQSTLNRMRCNKLN